MIRPSRLLLEGPGGQVPLERRMMEVLLALLEAEGAVISREELMERCWPGVVVGDDSVHRAISGLRKAAAAAGGDFEIQTVPRIGYRLQTSGAPAEIPDAPPQAQPASADTGQSEPVAPPAQSGVAGGVAGGIAGGGAPAVPRRWLLLGGAAGLCAAGIGLVATRSRPDPALAALLSDGQHALRINTDASNAEAAAFFARATDRAPDNAEAWGLLSRAECRLVMGAAPDQMEKQRRSCILAAERSLALDPSEPNGFGTRAMIAVDRSRLFEAEEQMLAAHKAVPANTDILAYLEGIAQATGQTRRSLEWNRMAMARDPLIPGFWNRGALKYWVLGDVSAADRLIDETMRRWPAMQATWNSRVLILAETGRAVAALKLLDEPSVKLAGLPDNLIGVWRSALTALASGKPSDREVAKALLMRAAPVAPGLAATAIMFLSALGETDLAYAVADGFLLLRGPLAAGPALGSASQPLVGSADWRQTQWLFTPITRPMLQHPRFPGFARDIGLATYWKQRGIWPDAVHGVPRF